MARLGDGTWCCTLSTALLALLEAHLSASTRELLRIPFGYVAICLSRLISDDIVACDLRLAGKGYVQSTRRSHMYSYKVSPNLCYRGHGEGSESQRIQAYHRNQSSLPTLVVGAIALVVLAPSRVYRGVHLDQIGYSLPGISYGKAVCALRARRVVRLSLTPWPILRP